MNSDHKSHRYVRPGAIVLMVVMVVVWVAGSGILLAQETQSGALVSRQAALETEVQSPDTILSPTDDTLLAIYILAFDNSRNAVNTVNLTTKYTETVESIVTATEGLAGVTAVILADLDDYGDTHILTVQNGVATPVAGLPDIDGSLNLTLTEYNTADGAALGGFLLWAREGRDGVRTTLSFIGHGSALPPASQPSIAELVTDPSNVIVRSPEAVPMPFRIGANPEFTDMHDADPANPYSHMLTPHDLALALDGSSNGGSSPYDVLDLVQCFGASIEELYEVAPYGATTVAAPNYAFFEPRMTGEALIDLAALLDDDPTAPAEAMANEIAGNYIDILPALGHPHVLASIDNAALMQVKMMWDELSGMILSHFESNPVGAAAALSSAYDDLVLNTDLYDSSFCGVEPDYTLGATDSLADMGQLAEAIGQSFQAVDPPLAIHAFNTANAVGNSILILEYQNGSPWWDETPSYWNFYGVSGISIFAPLVPMQVDGLTYHAWQSLWYTDTLVIAEDVTVGDEVVDVLNPYPYAFITRNGGSATWADVIDAYWRQQGIHPGSDVNTALCLPDIREVEEIDVYLVTEETADPIQAGTTMAYTLTVNNKTTLLTENVQLTNTLPADVTFTAVSDPTACQHAGGVVTCAWPEIAPHETITVVIDTLINLNKEGPMTNHAAVSVVGEKRTHDNQWNEETEVTSAWTMGMLGGVDVADADEGDIINYTAVIENTGVAVTTDAVLTRNWSSLLAVAGPISIEPVNLGVPSFIGNELVRIPSLAPGERLTVTVPLRLVDGPAPNELAELVVNSNEVDDSVTVAASINIANREPSVLDDAYTVGMNHVLQVAAPGLLANDIDVAADNLTAYLQVAPENGTLSLSDNADGSFSYTPNAGFWGVDSFSYISRDKDGGESVGVVVINVSYQTYLPLLVFLP